MNATTTAKLVEGGDGWLDGAPLSLPSEIILIDLLIYRRMHCPKCRMRGMKAVPQHNGERYRVLCSCRNCRHVEACGPAAGVPDLGRYPWGGSPSLTPHP
jgi:hypothetical protein